MNKIIDFFLFNNRKQNTYFNIAVVLYVHDFPVIISLMETIYDDHYLYFFSS